MARDNVFADLMRGRRQRHRAHVDRFGNPARGHSRPAPPKPLTHPTPTAEEIRLAYSATPIAPPITAILWWMKEFEKNQREHKRMLAKLLREKR